MKKLIIVYVVIIVLVIIFAIMRAGGNLGSLIPTFGPKATATTNGKEIKIILAKSDSEKTKGLSGRKDLPKDQGMLFIFDHKDKYGFWMKDMKFPIDIIYKQHSLIFW